MTSTKRLPYPGLRAFAREESDVFFGREGCVDAMVDRFAATRFLAVLGASGSGKSSLVRTGLLDALDLGLHPWAGSRWKVVDLHPGGQPMRNLAIALLKAKVDSSPEAMDIDLLMSFLARGPRSVVEWASGGNLLPEWNLLILVDQFEELFRYADYAQREEAEAFVALLLESATAPDIRVHVVVTMRSEYLGACSLIPGLAGQINTGLYLAPRMSREECRDAIEGPAGVIGFRIEPALVNCLLNDMASFAPWETDANAKPVGQLERRADQLPLMQHVLNRLWVRAVSETAGARVELKLSHYERLGGLSGALDAHGVGAMAALGSNRARHVEEVFRALVRGASPAVAVRQACRLRELVAALGGAQDNAVAVVEAFRAPDCNFLRTSHQSLADDDVIVDISHESLIRQWTPLTKWLEKETRASSNWHHLIWATERYAKGEGNLLTGLDLANFVAWWEAEKPTASWAERHGGQFEPAKGFLSKSQETAEARGAAERERDQRERTRLRRQRAILAAALVMTFVFGAGSYYEWLSAKRHEQEALHAARVAELQTAEATKQKVAAERALDAAQKEKARADESDRYAQLLIKLPGMKEAASAYLSKAKPDTVKGIVTELRKTSFKPSAALSTDATGVAIRGIDPVAYLREGRVRFGQPANYAIWGGGIWLFSNDENRSLFLADPSRYVPAYGGFCALCMAVDHKVHSDPLQWVVRGGRLYLHQNEQARQAWLGDVEGYIAKANVKWSTKSQEFIPPMPNLGLSDQLKEALAER